MAHAVARHTAVPCMGALPNTLRAQHTPPPTLQMTQPTPTPIPTPIPIPMTNQAHTHGCNRLSECNRPILTRRCQRRAFPNALLRVPRLAPPCKIHISCTPHDAADKERRAHLMMHTQWSLPMQGGRENRTRPAWSSQYLAFLKYYSFRTQILAGVCCNRLRDHSTLRVWQSLAHRSAPSPGPSSAASTAAAADPL